MFDTDIVIHALNGTANPAALALLENESPLPISIVTWMEVMVGATRETESATRDFLSRFLVYELDQAIAEQAVIYRRTLRLKLPDAIIYATARVKDRKLVTLNLRDFPQGTDSVLVP
jgi:predicted nucleic acid-binding protein